MNMPKIIYSVDLLHDILKKEKPSKVCVVTSNKLAEKLSWAIKKIGIKNNDMVFLFEGEAAKEWGQLGYLLKRFSEMNLDRNSIVIALGGGSIGDVTGFAASIYLRGIRYIQIPTSLLAQVDSAHGGKTGINFLGLKNQIGAFHLPIAIIIDARFIKSLSEEQIINGLGEIIKAGFIKDISILALLKKHTVKDLIHSKDIVHIIRKSIAVKDYFTKKDWRDGGARQILNFGHTIGHAIELKYKISHGRAVLVGMLQELRLMEELKLAPAVVRKGLEDLLSGLGIAVDSSMKADWKTIHHDKKVLGKTIDLPVIIKEGKAKLVKLDLEDIRKSINQ